MAVVLWALALWALAPCAMVALAEAGTTTEREQIHPSLECACRTSERPEDRFDLNCLSLGLTESSQSGSSESTTSSQYTKTTRSCARGTAVDNSAWRFAEVPGYGDYRLSTRFLSWSDAAAACETARELMATLDGGEAELKAVLKAFFNAASDRKELLWVGARYFEDESAFYTVRGQKMADLPWRPDHPIIRKNQVCVCVDKDAKLHGPHGCNGKRRFFCKG